MHPVTSTSSLSGTPSSPGRAQMTSGTRWCQLWGRMVEQLQGRQTCGLFPIPNWGLKGRSWNVCLTTAATSLLAIVQQRSVEEDQSLLLSLTYLHVPSPPPYSPPLLHLSFSNGLCTISTTCYVASHTGSPIRGRVWGGTSVITPAQRREGWGV